MDLSHLEIQFRKTFLDQPFSLPSLRRHIKQLEKTVHVTLRESAAKRKKDVPIPATIKFACEQVKCPFSLTFSMCANESKYAMSSMHLIHSHLPSSEKEQQLQKQLLSEVQEQSELVYQQYFLSKVTQTATQSIIFERPALILADYEKNFGFTVINTVEDPYLRVKLKKKFDNVIQVLRKRFQKEFPQIESIFEEFNQRRLSVKNGETSQTESQIEGKKEEELNGLSVSFDSCEETNWLAAACSPEPVRKLSATTSTLSEINSDLTKNTDNRKRAVSIEFDKTSDFQMCYQPKMDEQVSLNTELIHLDATEEDRISSEDTLKEQREREYFQWFLENRSFF